MSHQTLVLLIFVPLVVWRLHSRYRMLVGRQTFHARRLWVGGLVLTGLLATLAVVSFTHRDALAGLAGGMVGGAVVARFGLRATRFEHADGRYHYEPHPWIGLGVMAIILARILYKLVFIGAASGNQHPADALSPANLFVAGVLLTYMAGYQFGVIRWQRRHASALCAPRG